MKTGRLTKLAAWAAVAALILSLIPLLILARYDLPQNDDFGYARTTHGAWMETGNLREVLAQAGTLTAERYLNWQGTYAAIFMMTLQPGIWGMAYYALTPFLLIGSLLFGLWAFIRMLGKHALRLSVYERGILFSLAGIAMTQWLPAPLEGYYWFNGSILYGFFFALALVFFALLIGYAHRTPGKKRNLAYYILLPVLAALIAGGNYATGLQCALLMLAALCRQFMKKRRDPLPPLTLIVFIGFFLVNLLAPGNARRVSEEGGFSAALFSGALALIKTVRVISEWTTLPLLMTGAAIVPIAWRFARGADFRFRFPPLVMAASALLLAAGFMPTLYTMRYSGPGRLLDIQFYLYVLLFYANVFYSAGWLCQHMPERAFEQISARSRRVIAACAVLLGLMACVGRYEAFASFRAAESLVTGEAAGYYAERQANTAILEDPAVKDAVLRPLENTPPLLTLNDYPTDAHYWGNVLMSWYYHKDSVRTAEKSP